MLARVSVLFCYKQWKLCSFAQFINGFVRKTVKTGVSEKGQYLSLQEHQETLMALIIFDFPSVICECAKLPLVLLIICVSKPLFNWDDMLAAYSAINVINYTCTNQISLGTLDNSKRYMNKYFSRFLDAVDVMSAVFNNTDWGCIHLLKILKA